MKNRSKSPLNVLWILEGSLFALETESEVNPHYERQGHTDARRIDRAAYRDKHRVAAAGGEHQKTWRWN
jgi:hypothetical protein